VLNDSTGPCNNTFWTDLYVRTAPTPPAFREDGARYQALTYLGPNSSAAIQFQYTFPMSVTYYLYTQADTYQNVTEGDESNNWRGPLEVPVAPNPSPPVATPTATPVNPGGIAGTVWAFIGGQLVVPTDRVSMSVYNSAWAVVATTHSYEDGSYRFCVDEHDQPYFCIAAGMGYTAEGLVIIDGIPYLGSQSGIQVVGGQVTSPVDIILFPVY
jgi:hypothetical protein